MKSHAKHLPYKKICKHHRDTKTQEKRYSYYELENVPFKNSSMTLRVYASYEKIINTMCTGESILMYNKKKGDKGEIIFFIDVALMLHFCQIVYLLNGFTLRV